MVAVENMEGSLPDGDNEAPKDWARLEIQLSPDLKDDWPTTPYIDITNYDFVTQLALQFESGYRLQKELKSSNVTNSAKLRPPKPATADSFTGNCHTANNTSHLTPDGKLSQEIKEFRKKHNLCLFYGGNHPTHQCQRLIEKLAKEGKPPPVPYATPTHKVCFPFPSPDTALTIASLNNGKSVEVSGVIGSIKANVLVDGAAQVNACTDRLMKANPERNISHINKKISSFDGNVVVPADVAYESTLTIRIPKNFDGDVNFVEAPIKNHDAILGLPWLKSVNPDIDLITKTIRKRQSSPKSSNTAENLTNNLSDVTPSSAIIPTSSTINPTIQLSPLSSNDRSNETFISALVRVDAQQENEDVVIPDNLKFLSEAFSKSNAAKLPPHRDGVDMTIDIPDGKLPRIIPMSRLSEREKEEANKQTHELIGKR
ncbi:hypothetical protein K3495_g2941 [Podosphaera aphanis]|nr:hypothetical protein K3495_g2941 [Podosphaera aphanis]